MAAGLIVNDFSTTQSGGATNVATSIGVAAAIPGAGAADRVYVRNRRTGEIFLVTAGGNGTTWTVTREAEDASRFPKAAMIAGDNLDVIASKLALQENLVAYTAFTPTVTQSGSVTVSIVAARDCIIGKHAHVWFQLSVTGSGTGANDIVVTIPAALAAHANAIGATIMSGVAMIYDNGTAFHSCFAYFATATTIKFIDPAVTSGASVGSGPSFALAVNDSISANLEYELAA